jgi:leucyl-tRNA synthetase
MNTAISQMMVFVNAATQANTLPKETMETFLRLLTPYAPHIAEELWERLGHTELIAHTSWPTHDPEALKREEVTIVVQVNGKLRNRIQFPVDSSNADVEAAVLADEKIQGYIEGKTVRKVIVVPNRLVNIVV